LKLSAVLTYQNLDDNDITQKIDYFFQMSTSHFAVSPKNKYDFDTERNLKVVIILSN